MSKQPIRFGPYNDEQAATAQARDVLDIPPARGRWEIVNAEKIQAALRRGRRRAG